MWNIFNNWPVLLVVLIIILSISSCSDSPSSSETEVGPDFEFLFQWYTNGFIENNRSDEEILGLDIVISNETGEVIESFDLFKKNDGLLQFLPIEEFNIDDIPRQISVSVVYYSKWEFSGDANYQTAIITYTNVESGTVLGGLNSEDLLVESNFDGTIKELNSATTESIYLELLDIDNEFNDRFTLSSAQRRGSGYINNGELKTFVELNGKNNNALFVSVYPSEFVPNSDPRYWIVDDITDNVSLNYHEGYGELKEKIVPTPNGADFITVGASINENGISLRMPSKSSFSSSDDAYVLYPIDKEISRSNYSYTEESAGLTHSKYYIGEMFSEIEDPMSVQFDFNEVNIDSISVNQSGDHDIFQISFYENYSNYRNSWSVVGVKGIDNITIPNIDSHITTQFSNFSSRKLELRRFVSFFDYDSFSKDNLLDHSLLMPNETNYRMLEMQVN